MQASADGVTRICRAGSTIIAVQRRTRRALACNTRLDAIANIVVGALGIGRAAIRQRCSGEAHAVLTGLGAVARIAVVALSACAAAGAEVLGFVAHLTLQAWA